MLFSGVGAYFGAQCEKLGMIVRVIFDHIIMSPPFIMTPSELDEVSLYSCYLYFWYHLTKMILVSLKVKMMC